MIHLKLHESRRGWMIIFTCTASFFTAPLGALDEGPWYMTPGDTNGDGAADVSDAVYLLMHLFSGGPALARCWAYVPIKKTGVTICNDADGQEISCDSADYPGQDGFYQAGFPSSYTALGDGVVLDNVTHRVWKSMYPSAFSWREALVAAQGVSAAGGSDWRLPNIREAVTIDRYDKTWESLDGLLGPDVGTGTWSSTNEVFYPTDNYAYITGGGDIEVYHVSSSLHVFAVGDWIEEPHAARYYGVPGDVNGDASEDISDAVYLLSYLFLGGSEPAVCQYPLADRVLATGLTSCWNDSNEQIGCDSVDFPGQDAAYRRGVAVSYTDNGDATVTDNATGLMWAVDQAPTPLTWQQALQWAHNLELAGYTDWRLPNVRELLTLARYDDVKEVPEPLVYYWSSTPGTFFYTPRAWTVSLATGVTVKENKKGGSFARAVRGGMK